MFEKDYYQVLQLQPTASAADIRKAYRRLALEFHPDKNTSQQAAAQFVMIREAYAVLSDPLQRKKYDFTRFPGKTLTRIIATTPEEVRLMSDDLVQRIKAGNPDRINLDRLVNDLQALLSVYHIQLLEKYNDEQQNGLLISNVLFCIQYLNWSDCMQFVNTLRQINGLNKNATDSITHFLTNYKRQSYWNRYKIWVAFLIALITCVLIYYA
jgi:hypothetical protein